MIARPLTTARFAAAIGLAAYCMVGFQCLACQPSSAFSLSRTVTGQHTRWQIGPADQVTYTIDRDLQSDIGMGADFGRSAIVAATKSWQAVRCALCHCPRGVACSPIACDPHPLGVRFIDEPEFAPQAQFLGPTCVNAAGEHAGIVNGRCPAQGGPWKKQPNGNQVMFLTGDEWVFSQFIIALTLVAANQVSGAIADTDILLNARDKKFCGENCKSNEYDLQSTITHEVGHMLGLDHSRVAGATMVLQGTPGETFMRSLEADDRVAVCTAYRMAFDPNGCPAVEEGCSASPDLPVTGGGAVPLLLGLAGLLLARFNPCRARRR